jgi:hypothetical protein
MSMVNRLRRRLSYANVAATLALFLALGGGAAVAASQITARDIAKDAVGGSELKRDAAKGKHVKEDTLGPVPTAGKANNVLWAVVQDAEGQGNAVLVRAGQDTTGVIEGGGSTEVDFGARDVTNCVWSATRGSPGQTVEPAGFVQLNGGSLPTRVDVRTRNVNGEVVDGDFHLIVIC